MLTTYNLEEKDAPGELLEDVICVFIAWLHCLAVMKQSHSYNTEELIYFLVTHDASW